MSYILEILEKAGKALTLKEITSFFNSEDSDLFKNTIKELNQLIDDELVFEHSGRYDLCNRPGRAIGELVVRRNLKSYIYEKDEVYEALNPSRLLLLNNDRVVYQKQGEHVVILALLKHQIKYVVGLIRKQKNSIFFYPDEDNFPRGFKIINAKKFPLKDRDKVRCYVVDYQKQTLAIEQIIGHLYDRGIQEMSLLYQHDISLEFSHTTINEANSFKENILLSDYPNRKDLTNDLIITIDGDDAKDFDDAINVKRLNDNYLLSVHIADVSNYVLPNSSLDKEAFKRGTSIYYPGHVIPMLPEALSNGLCSLRPHEKRLAMTVEMEINKQGEIVNYSIYESVIESKYRMTYKNVNAIFAGDEYLRAKYESLLEMLDTAKELADILKAQRKRLGAIDFDTDEAEFIIKKGEVVDIKLRERGESEKLIEDFMIIANVCVASHMKYLEYPMVYRNHNLPKEERLETFIDFVENLGYHFKGNKKAITAKQLADCLDSFKDDPAYPIINNYCLKSMAKAEYDSICEGHYGLGLKYYCHFTSPIRRYPDLIVHRMLKKYLLHPENVEAMEAEIKRNGEISKNANKCERVAVEIERDMDDLFKTYYMAKRVGGIFDGVVSGVTAYGVYVKLANTVEGLVHVKNLTDGFYELQKDGSLSNGQRKFQIGDIVTVKCTAVNIHRGEIDFNFYKKRKQQVWI